MTDQQIDSVKELNSLDGRWITLLWVSLLAVGSGSLRLMLNEPRESVDVLLAGFGFLIFIILLTAALIFDQRMRRRTRTLQEDV